MTVWTPLTPRNLTVGTERNSNSRIDLGRAGTTDTPYGLLFRVRNDGANPVFVAWGPDGPWPHGPTTLQIPPGETLEFGPFASTTIKQWHVLAASGTSAVRVEPFLARLNEYA